MKDTVRAYAQDAGHRHDPEHDRHDRLDALARAQIARLTGGISPAALTQVWVDWAAHMASSPGKQVRLAHHALDESVSFWSYLMRCGAGAVDSQERVCGTPSTKDRRFHHDAWTHQPFHAWQRAFLSVESWWDAATTDVRGMSHKHAEAANFLVRQILDSVSPANFAVTNPEILQALRSNGIDPLAKGLENWTEDARRAALGEPAPALDDFAPGRDVAVTPGKVIFRNRLIELIQYEPTTDTVQAEPVLIVPAWIMKYYILDLSPQNSMVRYLVSQGFTVFMLSWRNPGPEDADLTMQDYRQMGPMAALDAVQDVTGAERVHGVGYCLGGTLLSITAAAMARDGDDRLASLSLFAAQMDFRDAGELSLFISEAEVTFLEDLMWREGYLDSSQMAGAFQLLRSNDLIWSRMQREYMMGERPRPNDMMAWNADSTRMPYRMHSEYLRELFLDNAFASNGYLVGGVPVSPRDIHMPIFALGTETDHVAPLRSVYKATVLTRSDVTFVLTNGGHNAGVVSEPGHPRRHYRMMTHHDRDRYVPPEEWQEIADLHDGSWWPAWTDWLAERSRGRQTPPEIGKPICDAPGTYVLMR